MRKIILASTSPRRKELLSLMGVTFEVVPSHYDEQLDDSRSVEEVAKELGYGKAHAVAEQYPNAIVIGSDTIVSLGSVQLGKPQDRAHARDMIRMLAGKETKVSTSLAVLCQETGFEKVAVDVTTILLKPFDAAAVDAYLDTGDYADKAGGFGVQSGFAPLTAYIDGAYDTLIGLPTALLASILHDLGIDSHPADVASPLPSKQLV